MQPMTIKTIFEDIFSRTNPKVIICFFLVLANAVVYWQVNHHDFINFDDDVYITENRDVQSGLKQDEIIWSFRLSNKNNTYWHPLTWMSHMLDAQLYGMDPGRHHMTNVSRNEDKITDEVKTYGWKVYVTDVSKTRLSFVDAMTC